MLDDFSECGCEVCGAVSSLRVIKVKIRLHGMTLIVTVSSQPMLGLLLALAATTVLSYLPMSTTLCPARPDIW